MKRIFCLAIIFALFLTSCSIAVNREKRKMLEICNNDENYITLTGKVVGVEIQSPQSLMNVVIECDELKTYFPNATDTYTFVVHSVSHLDLEVGDTIEFTTVKTWLDNKWVKTLPIVAVSISNENILNIQDGKQNLIDWINQLRAK